jgi:hypothetical protein
VEGEEESFVQINENTRIRLEKETGLVTIGQAGDTDVDQNIRLLPSDIPNVIWALSGMIFEAQLRSNQLAAEREYWDRRRAANALGSAIPADDFWDW